MRWFFVLALVGLLMLPAGLQAAPSAQAGGTTYYVSTSGDDDADGLSEATPFRTLAKVNGMDLQPGDTVLFKCGDTWQSEQLVIRWIGSESEPVTFGSYPEGCADKPVFSGSLPVSGWTQYSGAIYAATLPEATFPLGLNQLFRDGQRLTMGRWPNLDAGNGGYAFVDGHVQDGAQITDNELPAVDWTGAIVHIKNIRWSMLDRQVTGVSGTTLALNTGLSCLISSWGDCVGWGYFLNNHLATLDQDGEWYYDAATRVVYLYSASGMPEAIEGSVVLEDETTLRHGGIMLSDGTATAYVIVDNLMLKNWFNHGIGTPGGMSNDIYHHITVRNVTIKDVDASGVRLSSWLQRPSDGRQNLRGGHHMTFSDNVIDGANAFGITGYFADSLFENNTIKNIALIANLNKAGMSCGITSSQCTENGDGLRIRVHEVTDSGYGNTLRFNRFEKIGYNGVDVFGPNTTLEKNFITQSCFSKADCGGVRVFGSTSLAETVVYNVRLLDNIIVDIPGNVDGCHASRAAFGMGLYIDHYSRDVETRGNTVISTTITGILYQRSTGQIAENTVFNAASGTEYSAHISLAGDETSASVTHNVLYALNNEAWTLYSRSLGNFVTSDYNALFHPYEVDQIAHGTSWTRYTFPEWQVYSGLDAHSITNWFTQEEGEPSFGRIFYNATQSSADFSLGNRRYLTLDQEDRIGSITLEPFASLILVDDGPAGLQLWSLSPGLWEAGASGFTLTVQGVGFTESSVVRWNGSDRPTTFVSTSQLTAAIPADDVDVTGVMPVVVPVTVYDPAGVPAETPALDFYIVAGIRCVYLPMVMRQ